MGKELATLVCASILTNKNLNNGDLKVRDTYQDTDKGWILIRLLTRLLMRSAHRDWRSI